MLQITKPAGDTIQQVLSSVTEVEDPRVRIGATAEGVKMAIDKERPGDTVVEHEGEAVIVMDSATSDRLLDRRLDVDTNTSQFVFKGAEGS